jgi:hypothetical protein
VHPDRSTARLDPRGSAAEDARDPGRPGGRGDRQDRDQRRDQGRAGRPRTATGPHLRDETTQALFSLPEGVTTVGRGPSVDIDLDDPSVSRLHAELVRHGPHVYVTDMGLSTNGTTVNGRPVARRMLRDGDVVAFGAARLRAGGVARDDEEQTDRLAAAVVPDLTRREAEVLDSLCRPALGDEAFVAPRTTYDMAAELVVTEAAVKQHLLRLYQKFSIEEGQDRRARLANAALAAGVVRPDARPRSGEDRRTG